MACSIGSTMIKVSRTAISTRKGCEQQRYWMTEHTLAGAKQATRGIVSAIESESGAIVKNRGKILHEIAEMQFYGKPWDKYVADAISIFPEHRQQIEHALLRRCMLGWNIIRGPHYLTNFTCMSAEKEWSWHLSEQISQALRMDKILRSVEDDALGIMDFKTLSGVDPNWIRRQQNSDQTFLYVQALKERSQEYVMGIAYEGIIIGKWKDGWQHSPFVMGYKDKAGKVWPKYGAGREKVSLVGYSDEAWLKWAQAADILKDQYVTTGFINPVPELLLQRKLSTGVAELKWFDKMEHLREVEAKCGRSSDEWQHLQMQLVERNTDQCVKYGWEYACPYYKLCWDGIDDSGGYKERIDHHGNEEEE
jgi:hypothetical protein